MPKIQYQACAPTGLVFLVFVLWEYGDGWHLAYETCYQESTQKYKTNMVTVNLYYHSGILKLLFGIL